MICFDVSVNGKRLCTAGVGEEGVLTAILKWVWSDREADDSHNQEGRRRRPDLNVAGLANDERLDWLREQRVSVGDEVLIKVIDSKAVDQPQRRERREDPEIARRNRFFLYQALKREFEGIGEERLPEEVSPEEAQALRRHLYNEYKAEFEGDVAAS